MNIDYHICSNNLEKDQSELHQLIEENGGSITKIKEKINKHKHDLLYDHKNLNNMVRNIQKENARIMNLVVEKNTIDREKREKEKIERENIRKQKEELDKQREEMEKAKQFRENYRYLTKDNIVDLANVSTGIKSGYDRFLEKDYEKMNDEITVLFLIQSMDYCETKTLFMFGHVNKDSLTIGKIKKMNKESGGLYLENIKIIPNVKWIKGIPVKTIEDPHFSNLNDNTKILVDPQIDHDGVFFIKVELLDTNEFPSASDTKLAKEVNYMKSLIIGFKKEFISLKNEIKQLKKSIEDIRRDSLF